LIASESTDISRLFVKGFKETLLFIIVSLEANIIQAQSNKYSPNRQMPKR
jgi:hypothetical protein